MVDFGGNFFSAGGNHNAPQNVHAQEVSDHLGAVVPHKTGAMFKKGGPKIVETDEYHQCPEAFHDKRRAAREAFLPIDRKNEPIFFHAEEGATNAERIASVSDLFL